MLKCWHIDGTFLRICEGENCDVHGVESMANAYLHGNMDALVMIDVLEHLPEPVKTILDLRGLLKQGGILYICTPDANSILARLMGSYWYEYKEEHVILYSRGMISNFMRQLGFETVLLRQWSKLCNLKFARKVLQRDGYWWHRLIPNVNANLMIPSHLVYIGRKIS